MNMQKKVNVRAKKRAFRVRNSFVSKGIKPRVSVFRSLNHIYAQIIDDATQSTLASFSSLALDKKTGDKTETAKQVGLALGKLAR